MSPPDRHAPAGIGGIRTLVLASSSPRRRELLAAEGYDFELASPDIEELPLAGEAARDMALRLACEKAGAIASGHRSDRCILAADTIVVLGDRILGKPRDEDEAAEMLFELAGRTHRVMTGYALRVPDTDLCASDVCESRVRMRHVTWEEACAYARTGEPLDKAGAYAVQGEGGRFVEEITGSRTNVIGLPLEDILPLLERFGVRPR